MYGLLTLIVVSVTSSKANLSWQRKVPCLSKSLRTKRLRRIGGRESSTKESSNPEDQVDTSSMPEYVASAVKTAMRRIWSCQNQDPRSIVETLWWWKSWISNSSWRLPVPQWKVLQSKLWFPSFPCLRLRCWNVSACRSRTTTERKS